MDNRTTKVNNKQANLVATREIVISALAVGVGNKLPTNTEFRDRYQIGIGTIQRALNSLNENNSLKTQSKGHLGRIVTHLDIGTCWNVANLNPIQIAVPISGPVEIDVLNHQVTDQLNRLNIAHAVKHIGGSENRISGLIDGSYDMAIVSRGVIKSSGYDLANHKMMLLPSGSYYSKNRLVVVHRNNYKKEGKIKVAIDKKSTDHKQLTLAEFPPSEQTEYIETDFQTIPARLLEEEIDIGIWHVTNSPIPLNLAGLSAHYLTRKEAVETHERVSAATIIVNKKRPELNSVLNAIKIDDLLQIQAEAILEENRYARAFTEIHYE